MGMSWSIPWQYLGMPGRTPHEDLVEELKLVRRKGLHRLDQVIDELPTLRRIAAQTTGGEKPSDVEALLRSVYAQRSEGAQGTAIGILLGLELGRRGASPQVLRQVAADRLGYATVETFRKKPELQALETFAHLIESHAVDVHARDELPGYKVEEVMRLIENLTIAEYGDLVRRLRHRMSHLGES